jgi:hypothetical protein
LKYSFDPALGYRFVLIVESVYGPAVIIWLWVDDFIIYGPTINKTPVALKFSLDEMVKVGMLCHHAVLSCYAILRI